MIRTGTLDDLAEIQRLNQALFAYERAQGLHDDSFNQEWPFSQAGTKYFTESLKREGDKIVFIAEVDGRPVGYLAASCRSLTYRSANPVAELENMFVEETHRRQGTGTKLIDAFKIWAGKMGAKRLKVGTFAPNAPAINFYHKNGFYDFELILEMPAGTN